MSGGRISVWPPLPPTAWLRRPLEQRPFPLEEPGWSYAARAREPLFRALAARIEEGGEVLMPAYHHGAEVEAVLRAGLVPRFYDIGSTLDPDPAELEASLGPSSRALYLVHYLGFPLDAPAWRAWCDERGLLLVEDAAQAWLARLPDGSPAGSVGDVALFCLYKTVGLPDGALIRGDGSSGERRRAPGFSAVAGRHAAWFAARSRLAATLTGARRPGASDVANDIRVEASSRPPSLLTEPLLARLVDAGAAGRRRSNFRWLLEELGDRVPAPFRELPSGASPYVFPLQVQDRDRCLERLGAAGIAALDLWRSAHPALPVDGFPGAAALRAEAIGLPVHQELRPRELQRIVRAAGAPRRTARRPVLEELGFETDREEWLRLAEQSTNIFATPEWLTLWWQHFGDGRELLLRGARAESGRLEAILPLYFWRRRPVRVARFLGHGQGDQLGPICAPASRAGAARSLLQALEDGDVDVLFGEELPADDAWAPRCGGSILAREASPVLVLDAPDWDAMLGRRSRNFREQVRRRERKLLNVHGMTYRLASDPDRLDADMDALFALHAALWQGRSSAFGGDNEQFHRDFAAVALERGWLRLWLLEAEGRTVAAWYGLRFASTESYYQSARDPAWDSASVGFVLMVHSIREALADGMREYRLLRGDEQYKSRFATSGAGLETIGVARSLRGRAALAAGHVLALTR